MKLMGWSYYAEVGCLEEMSTLSSVNQSQRKAGDTIQQKAKQSEAGKKGLSRQEPCQAYFFFQPATLCSHFVTETISNNSKEF